MKRLLLTNDDGVDAPGLEALWQTVQTVFGDRVEVIVVAPDRCRSECGHSVSSGPYKWKTVKPGWYSVKGTPVDCVRVGLSTFAGDACAVLSGVNAGANLGIDLLVSGTFAAAREASIEGVPAMAVSHYRRPDVPHDWDHVPAWMEGTLHEFRDAISTNNGQAILWNTNLPAVVPSDRVPQVVRCEVDHTPHKRQATFASKEVSLDYDFHARPRADGSDVHHCFGGAITISEIKPHL